MTQVNYIRELHFREGKTYTKITEMTGFNYRTIKKYVDMDDFILKIIKLNDQTKQIGLDRLSKGDFFNINQDTTNKYTLLRGSMIV